jgi:hypothetical protein
MRRADGKMDKRSTAYKEAVARMKKARRAKGKSAVSTAAPRKKAASASSSARRADGRLDQRTAEGRAAAARMANARAARGKKKGFFTWVFGK